MTFKEITPSSLSGLAKELAEKIGAHTDEMEELLLSFCPEDADEQYAIDVSDGCAIIRVFDMGRYVFSYPYEMTNSADIAAAIESTVRYAVLEDLPVVFSDVPCEELPTLFSLGFRHIELDAEDTECESYRVRIISECELIDDIPSAEDGEVALTPLDESDTLIYAEISREETALRYWGYDYRSDAPNASDDYFYSVAERDFLAGVSMTLGIRYEDELVGEIQLYAFDRRGGADFAIRLLPGVRRKGIGKRSLELLFSLSAQIGLLKLYCDVKEENKPSVAFISSAMELCKNENGILRFEAEL